MDHARIASRIRQNVESVCANLSGFVVELLLRANMDIRALLSSITRRPQGPWSRTRLQKRGGTVRPSVFSARKPRRESWILRGVSYQGCIVGAALGKDAPSDTRQLSSQSNNQDIWV
jgi:hypothetical protein